MGSTIRRALHVAANQAIHLVARVGYLHPAARPGRYGVEMHKDVAYGDHERWHRLDVYEPKGRGGRVPVVVYTHGGGFSMLSKETHRIMALQFAARGYLVFNVDYRLGPEHLHPAPLEDAASAAIFARDNASRFGGDPSRIVFAGESAGANLAAALTVAAYVDRPEAVSVRLRREGVRPIASVPIYGMLDMMDLPRLWRKRPLPPHILAQVRNAAESCVGAPAELMAPRHPLASPLRLLEALPPEAARTLPPFFAACGTKDPLLSDTKRLGVALDRLGVENEIVIHPGEIHGYNVLLFRENAADMWRRTFDFLARHTAAPKTVERRENAS